MIVNWVYSALQSLLEEDLQRYALSFVPLFLWLHSTRTNVPGSTLDRPRFVSVSLIADRIFS